MDKFYLGMDVGATYIRFITYEVCLKKISNIKKKTFERYGDVNLEIDRNICKPINSIIEEMVSKNSRLLGIGVSLAAFFERQEGIITTWPNNSNWNNFPIKSYLERRFRVPVVIEDDANTAALGEYLVGAGRGRESFAYITISTGIGCGIIVNGDLFIGHNGWAADLGHIRVTDENTLCSCGNMGCLQAVASGPAILKTFMKTKEYHDMGDKAGFDVKDIKILAENNVDEAKRVFYDAGLAVGKAIANVVMLFDIPLIILGGGVMEAEEIIFGPIKQGVNQYLQGKRKISLVRSRIKENNGVYGALALIDKKINGTMTIHQ